jgi:hypothetical protein
MKTIIEKNDISLARHALTFADDFTYIFKSVENNFKEFIKDKFHNLIQKDNNLQKNYHDLNYEQKKQLFNSPEILNKILWEENYNYQDLISFFLLAIEIEKAKSTQTYNYKDFGDRKWSSDGSFFISHDGNNIFSTFFSPNLPETLIPIDYFSTNIRNVCQEHLPKEWETSLYEIEEAENLTNRIIDIYEKFPTNVKELVKYNTFAILMEKMPSRENLFTSGSDGSYIGRVLICNGHTVEDSVLVDALVHESIHGLLYMIDELNIWQPTRLASEKLGKIITSPWSSNPLNIRNLVQAIYVWYGLYNFWQLYGTLFSEKYRKDRLRLIEKGFNKLDLKPFENILLKETYQELCCIKNIFV